MRVRGASDPGLSHRCLATLQPCNWLGDQAGFPIRAGRPWTVGPSAAGRCSVLPWETLRARDDRRARRRTELAALEQLEGRQLLSYSSLGYSLPELQISGLAGPVASWGSAYQVTVVLQNTGASTIIEPLSLVPASEVAAGPNGLPVPPYYVPSSADAAASQVGIYLAPRPHSLVGAIEIGTATAPALSQNNIERFDVPLTLHARPAGFRSTGVYYIRLVANETQSVLESSFSNNVSAPIPVRFITQALPQLQATALDLPDELQPGDTVVPTFQITNLGTANTDTQAPVQVALVASVTPSFTLGSSIVALYTLPAGIPGQSSAPVKNSARHHARLYGSTIYNNNVTPAQNVETFTGAAVTLPTSPSTYYLGLVIDPNNTLKQLSLPANRLELIRTVGPATSGLPPAGVVSTTPLSQPFPNPPDGVPIGNVNPATYPFPT